MVKERRALVEGVKSASEVDPALEREFVFGSKAKAERQKQQHDSKPDSDIREGKGRAGHAVGRAPLSTRVRADYSAALKRASLERQLKGVLPNTLQDILEEALEPWLRSNGYLS
jgi:hypothetical protein